MPDLADPLRAVLPPGVVLGQGHAGALWPGESLCGAVPVRQAEFALGRSAARDAMQALGIAPVAVPLKPDRSPQWPDGIVGSISHCDGACFAILGHRVQFAGLGLDIEPTRPIDPDLWPVILRPDEDASDPLAVFVAKEAAYKAQFAITGTLFDFQTLSVAIAGSEFTAIYRQAVAPFEIGHHLHGRLARSTRHTAAICVITAS